jgi:hypothetical protein
MLSIRQAVTTESLFSELQQWFRNGAGRKRDRLLILSAFASGGAVRSLEPLIDVFLADGNFIEIIVGVDMNGTDKGAISRLLALQRSFPGQFSCHVFQAPSRAAIFHPKLYLYITASKISAVAGSGNLTLGGLGNNFESLFLHRNLPINSRDAKVLIETWNRFARPTAPLKNTFLRELTPAYARALIKKLPMVSKIEGHIRKTDVKALWQPISKIKLPRSNDRIQRQRHVSNVAARQVLIIDVLTETRKTQMQLPLIVVEKFFGLRRDQKGSIQLSYVRDGELAQSIERNIVISSGAEGQRLMRRLEMPSIGGYRRPLAAAFFRLARRRFCVALLPRNTVAYRHVNRLLERYGQQPDHAARRYYIGHAGDPLTRRLRSLVAKQWRS